jgi:glutaredoxin
MFCNRAKEFLLQQGVSFEEHDIVRDPAALEELERRGFAATPVVFVGEDVVVGFDPKKLSTLLGL